MKTKSLTQMPMSKYYIQSIVLIFILGMSGAVLGVGGSNVSNVTFTEQPVALAVDLNRDGKITLDDNQVRVDKEGKIIDAIEANDKTTPELPYRFWVNNDLDVVNYRGMIIWSERHCDNYNTYASEYQQQCEQWDEDTNQSIGKRTNTSPAGMLGKIETYRDLEDFAPLLMRISKGFNSKDFTIKLKAVGVSVNLFKSSWSDTDNHVAHEYIFNTQKTIEQASKGHFATVYAGGAGVEITQQIIDDNFDPVTGEGKFIFEAIAPSPSGCATTNESCYLELELSKNDDETFGKISSKVYMDIHDIKDYYELVKAGPSAQVAGSTYTVEGLQAFHATYNNAGVETQIQKALNIYDGLFPAQQITKDYVLQIHGWRMRDAEKTNFSETSFKRLYWSGYKGQMGALHWPTGWFDKPAYEYGAGVLPYVLGNERNYDVSDAVARRIGVDLVPWLEVKKQTGTNIHAVPHSMGNVLLSEALRHGAGSYLTSYAASQAATAAGSYNSNAANMSHNLQPPAWVSCAFDTTFSDGVNPEEAWRCYNEDNATAYDDTPFDMPPDMYRYNFIVKNEKGEPELGTDGGFIIRHGQTTATAMDPDSGLGHYYAGVGDSLRIINLFNAQDAALNAWEFNQLTKPDFAQGETWYYSNSYLDALIEHSKNGIGYPPSEPAEVTSNFRLGDEPILYNKDTVFDIMAHAIPARTHALGQVETHGEIKDNAPLLGLTTSNQDHSAPFHGYYAEKSLENNAQQRAAYWNKVLDKTVFPFFDKNNLTGLANDAGL